MCIVCEHELWDEHRALEREFFKSCKRCKKFPGGSSQGPAITVSLLGTRLTSAPSAQANLGVKNSSRPKRKSKVQTRNCSRSSRIYIGAWVRRAPDPSPRGHRTAQGAGWVYFAGTDVLGAGAPRSNPSVLRSSSMSGQRIP